MLSNGEIYGTLCCFSHHVNGRVNHQDLRTLGYTAQLAADRIEQARG